MNLNLDERVNLPREDSQYQVQDKKRTNDDQGDEVEPVPAGAQGVVSLKHHKTKA